MRKISPVLMAVLVCVLIFCGCEALSTGGAQSGAQASTGGEPSASESAAESERSEPSQEEKAEESLLPPVEGPDEEGKFPAVSRDFYNEYIENSRWAGEDENLERPNDKDITPFLKDVQAQAYLKSKFPGINDWEVLFEYHCYTYNSSGYNPYKYSFSGYYFPYYYVILATEQGKGFDRVFIYGEEYITLEYNGLKNEYVPQYTNAFLMDKTTENYLNCGSFNGAKAVYNEQSLEPVIWVPETATTLYINYDKLTSVTVNGAVEPLNIRMAYDSGSWYFSDYVKKIKPVKSRTGDAILELAAGTEEYIIAYYDTSEQTVAEFENIVYNNDYYYDFVTNTLMECKSIGPSAYYFYDFSDGADPTKCVLTLRGNGGKLAGGAFNENRVYSATADRNADDRYMLIYADNAEEKFYIVYFSFAEGILTQITLDESPEGYIGDYSVRGGIAYISYNGGDGFEHYAVDLRPDKDHTLQANAW